MKKILLDTDIGSDIDDAMCLAYLLSHPDCDLLGITTVSGEPVKRAMLASAICKIANQKIDIYPGVADPLLTKQKQPVATQAKALKGWEYEQSFPEGQAIEFLRETIHSNPGEVSLLGIGPLTNIALLFSIDPEIPYLLKELVLMGGIFTNRIAGAGPLEWNILCDPYAAAMVYHAPVKVHRTVGLDVTKQVTINKMEMEAQFKAKILEPVVDFARVWFEHREEITFHDPLAAATIFDENICSFERGIVEIELESPKLKGYTHWAADSEKGIHEVAFKVDRERFLQHYFSIVNRY